MIYTTVNNDQDAEARVRDTDSSVEVVVIRKAGDMLSVYSDGAVALLADAISNDDAKLVARDCLRLPAAMCHGNSIYSIIQELEKIDSQYFSGWQESPWLKGSLILPLDENGEARLCGYKLKYDGFSGLEYRKEGDENE